MKQETNLLKGKKKVPLLEEVQREKIRFEERLHRRKKHLYRAYLVTASMAILLSICILILVVSDGKVGILSSMASGIMRLDFMNLSGNQTVSESSGEPSNRQEGILLPNHTPSPDLPVGGGMQAPSLSIETLYDFDYGAVPSGELPILPMDLALTSYGRAYIQNLTGLSPNTEALLQSDFQRKPSMEYLSRRSDEPTVLILHTHATESYSPDGAISYVPGNESLRSENIRENVVSVGEVLANALEERGIVALHCTVLHDRIQYKDSYARAEETIRAYLAQYPSIKLVIDLHRDAVMKSTGEMVRPVTLNQKKEATAQVMCVVGSSWRGEANDRWEGNLALALKLRAELNQKTENLCRPPYLCGSTYNQEIAPYSLLIEVGAGGNSLAEAKRAAVLIADALATLLPKL